MTATDTTPEVDVDLDAEVGCANNGHPERHADEPAILLCSTLCPACGSAGPWLPMGAQCKRDFDVWAPRLGGPCVQCGLSLRLVDVARFRPL